MATLAGFRDHTGTLGQPASQLRSGPEQTEAENGTTEEGNVAVDDAEHSFQRTPPAPRPGPLNSNVRQKLEMKIQSKYYEQIIRVALYLVCIITVIRALRWPNDWAEAQWLISYNFGFIKRGIIGTLFLPFANRNPEFTIGILSMLLFIAMCVLLLSISMRIIRLNDSNISSLLLSLLFFTSPYLVMSAHLNGYFDNILILLTVFACVLLKKNRILFSSFVVSVGVLTHEIIFVVGFPSVVFFAMVQHIVQTKPPTARTLALGFISRYKALVFMPVFVFLCLVLNQTFLDATVLRSQLISHLSQFTFIECNRNIMVPDAITNSFFDYLSDQSPKFMYRICNPIYIPHIGLALFIIILYVWRVLKDTDFKWVIFVGFTLIVVLPLALHVIAWDTSRIWTYPLVVAFLGVWSITEAIPPHRIQEESIIFFIFTIMVIAFQIFISTPLMDGEIERFSTEMRFLLYLPPIMLVSFVIARNYCLTLYSPDLPTMEDQQRGN